MNQDREGRSLPLVILDEQGRFLTLALQNDKGYTKSVEQGSLWLLTPDASRVLPWEPGGRLLAIDRRSGFFVARVGGQAAQDQPRPGLTVPEAASVGADEAGSLGKAEASLGGGEILETLAQVVSQRHREMPAGSYTTHLFNEGLDKIRKKTGEEAVELLLARRPEDVVYEAADLVYHLVVLLEAEGLGLEPLLEELKKRAAGPGNP